MSEINNKNNNRYKNLINVDMIEAYMDVNEISKENFCLMCNIDMEMLKHILNRTLDWVPYALDDIARG